LVCFTSKSTNSETKRGIYIVHPCLGKTPRRFFWHVEVKKVFQEKVQPPEQATLATK
jgi:hypothetical protein